MSDWAEVAAIVLDNGSCWTKGGEAGQDSPSALVPAMIATEITDYNLKDQLSTKYVMDHGIISNKDDIELLWHNLFENELKIDPSERPILLTDAAQNPISNKETMFEIMFETFNVPATYIGTYLNYIPHVPRSLGYVQSHQFINNIIYSKPRGISAIFFRKSLRDSPRYWRWSNSDSTNI